MFMRPVKAILIGAAVTTCLLLPRAAIPKEELDRSDKEAIGIFEYIISTDKNFYKKCVVSDRWLDYSVNSATVRRYMKYTVRGDLTPPHHMTHPKDIIGRVAGADGLICNEKEHLEQKNAALDASKVSGKEAFRGKAITASTSTFHREFSYPIFDVDYRTAFIVRHNSKRVWFRTEDNLNPSFGDGEIGVLIYRKKQGRWNLIGYEGYASFS